MDDADKALKFVSIFIPGFVCFAFVKSLVFVDVSDFHFTYIAIAISILIYAAASGLAGAGLWLRCRVSRFFNGAATEPAETASPWVVNCLIVLLVPAMALIIAKVIERDWILLPLKNASPWAFEVETTKSPSAIVFNHHDSGNLYPESDSRTVEYLTKRYGSGFRSEAKAKQWVRLWLTSNAGYEGRIRWYSIGGTEQVFLSPTCKIFVSENRAVNAEQLAGPGVLVQLAQVAAIEFIDASGSNCKAQFK